MQSVYYLSRITPFFQGINQKIKIERKTDPSNRCHVKYIALINIGFVLSGTLTLQSQQANMEVSSDHDITVGGCLSGDNSE